MFSEARYPTRGERLRWLEEYQRDLAQRVADVPMRSSALRRKQVAPEFSRLSDLIEMTPRLVVNGGRAELLGRARRLLALLE
jgi:hypothetical protein